MVPAYATAEDVAVGFRPLRTDEITKCDALIIEAGVMIDAAANTAPAEIKKVVTCRMVRRALGSDAGDTPLGATQGTVSALGYSQTWAMASGGSTGELYIGKAEKAMLGIANKIGASNPYMEESANA